MPTCVVCNNNSWNRKDKPISFHRFPPSEEKRQEWIVAVKSHLRQPWTVEKILGSFSTNNPPFVCSEHFSSNCCADNLKARFVPYKVAAKVLFGNAVPTVFGEPSELRGDATTREQV